jgi:hypothetical protein
MDKIFLDELKIDTIIGIWDWERKIRQTVVIDLEMSADIAKAAATDDVVDTLNYKAVAKRLQAFVGDSSCLWKRSPRILHESFETSSTLPGSGSRSTSRAQSEARKMSVLK